MTSPGRSVTANGRTTTVLPATVGFSGFDGELNVLAATWRVYFDCGCALVDDRAAFKAKGAA